MWAAAASAQALNAQAGASEHAVTAQTFNCRPVEQSQNRIVAADPSRAIRVSLTLTDKKATEFKVLYVDDNGEKSSPADETKPWRLVTTPGSRDYNWYAVGSRRPNLLMHGRLFERDSVQKGENRWSYSEEQFELGIRTVDYHATCVEQERP